jgi:hypothetical protein
MTLLSTIFRWAALVSIFLLIEGFSSSVLACNYYASPSGAGNGLSPTSPFKIANFWAVAGPGKTLCLLDGVYSDSSSTINPPENLNGTASQKITVKALNDGEVIINGNGARRPIALVHNDHFIIEGINAHNSSSYVVVIGTGADNNTIRRVIAWDAHPSGNVHVWQINGNTGNLLEDVAGFGTGRKIFSNSQGGNNLTIRRAWGMWEKTLNIAPKMTYTSVYNSRGATYENVIGTWNQLSGSDTSQSYGIFGVDQNQAATYCTNSKILGSLAYLPSKNTQNGWIAAAMGARAADCYEFKDLTIYIDRSDRKTISASKFDGGSASNPTDCPVCDRRITNFTEVGGSAATINTSSPNGWQVANRIDVDTISAMNSAGANPFQPTSGNGARMCFRYVNRVLTSTPLWPWPMNQRIIEAMRVAGKTPVDVTRTLEEIFGPIPSGCRSGSVASSAPATTTTVSVPTSPTSLIAR